MTAFDPELTNRKAINWAPCSALNVTGHIFDITLPDLVRKERYTDKSTTKNDTSFLCIASTGVIEIYELVQAAEKIGCSGLFIYPDLDTFTGKYNFEYFI